MAENKKRKGSPRANAGSSLSELRRVALVCQNPDHPVDIPMEYLGYPNSKGCCAKCRDRVKYLLKVGGLVLSENGEAVKPSVDRVIRNIAQERRLDKDLESQIIAMLENGTGILKTARHFGVGTSPVQRIRREMSQREPIEYRL